MTEQDQAQTTNEPTHDDIADGYAEQLLAEAGTDESSVESVKADPGPWDDPKVARAEIEKLRKENAKDRTAAKDNARTELLRELGLVKDESKPVDPAELAKQLQAKDRDARVARVELAIFKNATEAGADPAALLDSASFLASTADLDPSDGGVIADAIRAAVQANPRLAAQQNTAAQRRMPDYSPAGDTGSSSRKPVQLTHQDVKSMSPDQIMQAREAGRLDDLLSGRQRSR